MVAPFKTKNVFDLTHNISFTCNATKLIPMMYEEVYPGDYFRDYDEIMTKAQALIAPVYAQFDIKTFYFFVPFRLVWKNWQSYITGGKYGNDSPNKDGSNPYVKPYVMLTNPAKNSLAAYLGAPCVQKFEIGQEEVTYNPGTYKMDAMPFRAIQLIWNEYFRDENLQDEVEISLEDGEDKEVNTLELLTKCWERDRYTSALPWPQRGDPVYLPLEVQAPVYGTGNSLLFAGRDMTETGLGATVNGQIENSPTLKINSFNSDQYPLKQGENLGNGATVGALYGTVGVATREQLRYFTEKQDANDVGLAADLTTATAVTPNQVRTAFQIQKFLYNSGRKGYRYVEQIQWLFGVRAPDASLQRPEFIGGGSSPLRISEVLQTSGTTSTGTPQSNRSGSAMGWMNKHGFTKRFDEYGMIIGFYCIMPRTVYQQGLNKMFSRETKFDYLVPTLSHLGMEAVKNKELFVTGNTEVDDDIFGYQDRYDELRHRENRVAGDFVDNLNYWTVTRKFQSTPALNAQFVEASMDKNIFAITDQTVDSFMVSINHNMKAKRPLPRHGDPAYIDHE